MCQYPAITTIVHSSLDQGWEGSLHLVPSLYQSCAEITTHHRSGRAPEREEKDTLHAEY